jgi:hypothetical protein
MRASVDSFNVSCTDEDPVDMDYSCFLRESDQYMLIDANKGVASAYVPHGKPLAVLQHQRKGAFRQIQQRSESPEPPLHRYTISITQNNASHPGEYLIKPLPIQLFKNEQDTSTTSATQMTTSEDGHFPPAPPLSHSIHPVSSMGLSRGNSGMSQSFVQDSSIGSFHVAPSSLGLSGIDFAQFMNPSDQEDMPHISHDANSRGEDYADAGEAAVAFQAAKERGLVLTKMSSAATARGHLKSDTADHGVDDLSTRMMSADSFGSP